MYRLKSKKEAIRPQQTMPPCGVAGNIHFSVCEWLSLSMEEVRKK